MRHRVPSGFNWTLLSIATLSYKLRDFWENVIEHKMCVLISSTILSEMFLILRRIQRDMIKNVRGLEL